MRGAGYVQMVREVARSNGQITRKEVKGMLGTEARTDHALCELLRQGCLERIARGVYRYVPADGVRGPQRQGRRRDKEMMVRRAMLLSGRFTALDIAAGCDVTDSYVYKLIRRYEAMGWIAKYGRKRYAPHHVEQIWRVTVKGREAFVRGDEGSQSEINPLAEATAELTRIVLLGLFEVEEDRRRAVELCHTIAELLRQGGDVS